MQKQDAIAYFHSLLRFGMKPGLVRIKKLMRLLGDPQDRLRFIHIAGTNGKGSTAVMLSGIFRAGGFCTGLYTSPYITDFTERIQIDGVPIDAETLCLCTDRVRDAVERLAKGGDVITEFEAVTAAAFLCFLQKKCEIVILETGLGGRFDATNIIRPPLVSVITSISLDHTAILGDTTARIAYEKGGIVKEKTPVVIPSTLPEDALTVLQTIARERHCPLYIVDTAHIAVSNATLRGFTAQSDGMTLTIPFPNEVQAQNALLAVRAARLCTAFSLTDENIRAGIAAAKNPARCELLNDRPPILLDGSHNPASTAALAALLRRRLPEKRILALLGMMADKDIDTCLDALLPCFTEVLTVAPSNPRAIDAQTLAEKVRARGKSATPLPSPEEAVNELFARLDQYEAAVICGSLYLAGDVRTILLNEIDKIRPK